MNKERSGRYIKCKIVQPGPDLSRPDVGALRPSPEEVWRRREPELVQRSGFKNLPLGQSIVSHWPAHKNGWGRGEF